MHGYEFEHDDNGKVSKIWKISAAGGKEREPILIDANSQLYCDFLTERSKELDNDDAFGSLPQAHYFADFQRFVQHCKEDGIRIFVHFQTDFRSPKKQNLFLGHNLSGIGSPEAKFKILDCCDNRPADDATDRFAQGRATIGVSSSLAEEICKKLNEGDLDVRGLSSLSVERAFVYIDISDFSPRPPAHQILIIEALVKIVNRPEYWDNPLFKKLFDLKPSAQLCIGDGYIFVFEDSVTATVFAAQLALVIETMIAVEKCIEFHFRMGVHAGEVYCFWDPAPKRWNYIGQGINDAARVLEAIGKKQDDVVFVSGKVRNDILRARDNQMFESIPAELLITLHNRGRKKDKHRNIHRVYELNHIGFGRLPDGLDPQKESVVLKPL